MEVLKINRYLIIFTCYFYVFAEKDFCEYIDIIYIFIDKENLDFVSIIYTIYIGVAFISLLRIIAYNFLYFNYNVVSNEIEK